MPVLNIKRDDTTSFKPESLPSEPHLDDTTRAWILVAIIAGVVLVVALAVFLIFSYINRKRYREAKLQDPYITREQFRRQRKMSEVDRIEEAEMQRSIMIRKSLESRHTLSKTSHTETAAAAASSADTDTDEDEEQEISLRYDWKKFEARMQREQSNSGERHPAGSGPSGLPVPAKSRTRSPSQSPLLRAQPSPSFLQVPSLGPPIAFQVPQVRKSPEPGSGPDAVSK